MRRIKLTKEEKAVENALIHGEYRDVSKAEFNEIARAVAIRRKDAVLNIRVNSRDLKNIRCKLLKMRRPSRPPFNRKTGGSFPAGRTTI